MLSICPSFFFFVEARSVHPITFDLVALRARPLRVCLPARSPARPFARLSDWPPSFRQQNRAGQRHIQSRPSQLAPLLRAGVLERGRGAGQDPLLLQVGRGHKISLFCFTTRVNWTKAFWSCSRLTITRYQVHPFLPFAVSIGKAKMPGKKCDDDYSIKEGCFVW